LLLSATVQHPQPKGNSTVGARISRPRAARRRVPSTSAYMVAAAAASAALFFVLWWMLQGEENPWVPAGLAASVVMLVAAFGREVVMRRALTRYLLDDEPRSARHDHMHSGEYRRWSQAPSQSELLRGLEKQSAEADANTRPELHSRVFQMCGDFLQIAEKSLTSPGLSAERRLTVRARQERVRALQKHHMLTWARNSAQALTQEAQQRARLHEKIEAANRALECIDTALANYPEEEDLQRSAAAVREFVTTSRVAHWVELAQRASFKGRYSRAIDCYRDALFYLTRAEGDHYLAAEQITREIELLRARRATHSVVETDAGKTRRAREN